MTAAVTIVEVAPRCLMQEAMEVPATPQKVKKLESSLEITWSNGEATDLSFSKLRSQCPCAQCKEERGEGSHDKPLSGPTKSKPALKVFDENEVNKYILSEIHSVGNYAIGLTWGDGHRTGIYTYEFLRELVRS